jgi:dTDP-L-rhamnose 4-epimerase
VADVSRLQTLLNTDPLIDLEKGLSRFARWVLQEPLPEDRLGEANAELQRRNMMGRSEPMPG